MESSSVIHSEGQESRNWLELPAELWSMILHKIGAIDILTHARYVCSSFRKICKDPLMWRVINTHNVRILIDMVLDFETFETLCRHAIDLSCGRLVDINIHYFGTDMLLQYIVLSSNQLRRLGIDNCGRISDEGLIEAISKLPLLEHLELINCLFDAETIKTVGKFCPFLKSFKLNDESCMRRDPQFAIDNDDALAIAQTMPKLQHLEIIGNLLTNEGLHAILDGCPDLEFLNLCECLNIDLNGQLGQECARRIKNVLKGCEYSTRNYFYDSEYSSDYNYDSYACDRLDDLYGLF